MRKNWSAGDARRYREQISTSFVYARASSFENSNEPPAREIELRDTNTNARKVTQ